MIRSAASLLVLLAAVTVASGADRLLLRDGRDLQGRLLLRPNADEVILIAPDSIVKVPLDQVVRASSVLSVEKLLEPYRIETDNSHADAAVWLKVARQLDRMDLRSQACSSYMQVLKRNPNHIEANRALGNIRIDGRWMSFYDALDKARRLLASGEAQRVLDTYIPAMAAEAKGLAWLDLQELTAEALLQQLQFDQARNIYTDIVKHASGSRKTRYTTMAELLHRHPGGMIVLDNAWPPQTALLNPDQPILPAGPVSLSHPHAVAAAMHQYAREKLRQATDAIDRAAQHLEQPTSDPDQAQAALEEVRNLLDQADALHEHIAWPYRLDGHRLVIRMHRKRANLRARDFDDRLDALQAKRPAGEQYLQAISGLIEDVDTVQAELQQVQQLAALNTDAYQKELILARDDLATLRRLRELLAHERRRVQQETREVANAS